MLYNDDTFTHEGHQFRVTFPFDDTGDAPWEREDGHGPVSDWRAARYSDYPHKAPGERPLVTDHRSVRFYDFAEACKIALRDGWLSFEDGRSFGPYMETYRATKPGIPMWAWIAQRCEEDGKPELVKIARRPRMRADRAAESDFNYLRRWCNDEWQYLGVVVEMLDDEEEPNGFESSVWGIESEATDYLEETAHDLASECLAQYRARYALAMG